MNYYQRMVLFVCAMLLFNYVNGQSGSIATRTGTQLLSLDFSLRGNGGELYNAVDGDRLSSHLDLTYYIFAENKLNFGLATEIDLSVADGRNFVRGYMGAQMGYFFDSGNNLIPYVNYRFSIILDYGNNRFEQQNNGFRHALSGGYMVRLDHIALLVEGGINLERHHIGDDNIEKSLILNLSIGVGYFIYKDK